MAKVDVERLTHDETVELFKELLAYMQEAEVLTIMRDWLKDNELEGEL